MSKYSTEEEKQKQREAASKYYYAHKKERDEKQLAYYHAHKVLKGRPQKGKRKTYKEYYDEHKEEIKEKAKVWRKKHKEEIEAYYRKRAEKCGYSCRAVTHALRFGEISKQPCEVCGSTEVEAHHCDYNKPADVMWLCHKHHKEWHKNNTPIYK